MGSGCLPRALTPCLLTTTPLWPLNLRPTSSRAVLFWHLFFLPMPAHEALLSACWWDATLTCFLYHRERKVPRPGSGRNQLPGPPGKDQKWTTVGADVQQDLRHPPGDHAGHRRGGKCRPGVHPARGQPSIHPVQCRSSMLLSLSPCSCLTTSCSASPTSWTTWASREPSCLWASRSRFPAGRRALTRYGGPAWRASLLHLGSLKAALNHRSLYLGVSGSGQLRRHDQEFRLFNFFYLLCSIFTMTVLWTEVCKML